MSIGLRPVAFRSFVRIIDADGEVPLSMCNYCSSVLTYFQSLFMYTSGRAMYCFVLMFILVLPTTESTNSLI